VLTPNLFLPCSLFLAAPVLPSDYFDVVVVGATPAGIAAAYNAAREGVKVAIVEETMHIGGLASGGLSNTDFRDFESVGGTFLEFMRRVEAYYAKKYGSDSQQVKDCVLGGYYEPSVARQVFEEMLADQRVSVFKFRRLAGAEVKNRRLAAATFENLRGGGVRKFTAQAFIDGTYEGDLIALAGVPYHLGCEAKSKYGESLAPDQENKWVQTYNFRVCMTRDPANSLGLPKPEGYRPEDFAILAEQFRSGKVQTFANPEPHSVLKIRRIPNQKADFNDMPTAYGLALKNINHPWVEGGSEVRAGIFDRYKRHSLGLFYFLANDAAVPEDVRKQMAAWGIPKDEYKDSENWTPALYVREGRRMIGDYVFTQKDAEPVPGSLRSPVQLDSIAIGHYSLNCHGVYSPKPGVNFGAFGQNVSPYQIPYRVLLPPNVDGLLAPVAVSASHVGYSTIRMEPHWTALGQAAGVAAAWAVRQKKDLRALDVPQLQARLHELGAMTVYIPDLGPERKVARPSWDQPGYFTVRRLDEPAKSTLFRAAQYFGTRGYFHSLADPKNEQLAKRFSATGQWSEARMDLAIEPGKLIDEALASQWLKQAGVKKTAQLRADGRLTRGEFLERLHRAVSK